MTSESRASNLRPLLYTAAILFAAATVLYSAAWMYYIRRPTPVEIGIDSHDVPGALEITNVVKGAPAERAGLKVNDHILAINGVSVATRFPEASLLARVWQLSRPGETVVLTIQRTGVAQPFEVRPVFRSVQSNGDVRLVRTAAEQILASYPVVFLIVGLAVLFLRVDDSHAWLLALVFATFIAVSGMPPDAFGAASPSLRLFLLPYRTICNSSLAGLFYFFFAVFPSPSPIERKAPWLKWLLLAVGLYLGLGGIRQGDLEALPPLRALLGEEALGNLRIVTGYGTVLLGLVSLVLNFRSNSDPLERRKLKVVLWGTAVGITPVALVKLASDVTNFRVPFWLDFVDVLLLLLFPVSFAYAVVKHRVMEIPVLLKRSARYFVVERGFVFLILAISVGATLLLAQLFSRHFSAGSKAAIPVGATFGVLLISAGTQVHRRVRSQLDRAFFRSAYDAQQILENLAAKTLTVSTREDLAALLHQNIEDALHPISLFVYLENGKGQFSAYAGNPPADATTLSPQASIVALLAARSEPMDLNAEQAEGTQLAPLRAECLVPIRGSNEGVLQGGIVLGPRLSEETYSMADKRLLASVASQAGIAMRSITLAEKMAERMEVERSSQQEMEIARQVQRRLLPQQAPSLPTLECAGLCIQTRAVGGDYYDFLDFGSGRLGLVLADIAGKGMSGALLMANLQANLRTQYALALEDLPKLLRSVNHLFFTNTEGSHYATMFFALYDDENRRLRYVNCGHNPPLLVRACGDAEPLKATATVLGLFEDWECSVAERELAAGDVLLIYTDGVSEAAAESGEEFGEERMVAEVLAHRHGPAQEIMETVIAGAQRFSYGEQADDMTLIVARAR